MGAKSRQLRATIKQARAQGLPVTQAVKVARQVQSGAGPGGAGGGAGLGLLLGPTIRAAQAGLTAIGGRVGAAFARPGIRQAALIGGTTAAAVGLGEFVDGGQVGTRGGLKGVVLIDASTGLRLGIISRKKALRVLQRAQQRRLPAKTKFFTLQNGQPCEVKV